MCHQSPLETYDLHGGQVLSVILNFGTENEGHTSQRKKQIFLNLFPSELRILRHGAIRSATFCTSGAHALRQELGDSDGDV